jgi:lysophospholipase L1-like esterase
MLNKKFIFSVIFVVISIVIALCLAEGTLLLKNSSMRNYDIEMWRYSKELKKESKNPLLGHEHIPSKEAILQSVKIRTNRHGLRGDEVKPKQESIKRILFLGSSITLGWGVAEEETLTERLEDMFNSEGKHIEILNAGIGNYNSVRYVEHFLTRLTHLEPNVIVVQYFVNDAEAIEFARGNWFLRNSQFGVTLWTAWNRFFKSKGEEALLKHYNLTYAPNNSGFQQMVSALKRLAGYAKDKNISIMLVMTPDFHNFKDYPFNFIHHSIAEISRDLGFVYVDLLPTFLHQDAKKFWSMPGDPHPNSFGHELMANTLYPFLKNSDLYINK